MAEKKLLGLGERKLVGKPTKEKTKAGRTVYKTDEGERVSEKSRTIPIGDKWYNVPSIHAGKKYTEDELKTAIENNRLIPTSVHDNKEEAIDAAKKRSNKLYKGGTPMMNRQMDMFREGGLNQEGGMIDAESGNEVPVGSTREEVRDDIPAKLSEGEFVMPADVVRYHGLDKMMALRDEAKMGLRKMDAMGQMGNSDEATLPEEMPFGMADLIVVAEDGKEVEMAEGGYVTMANGGLTPRNNPLESTRQLGATYRPPTNLPIDFKKVMGDGGISFKEYRNAQGENLVISFIGGVPLHPIPEGYTEYTPGVNEPITPIQELVQQAPTIPPANDNDNDQINRGYSLDDITNVSAGMILEEERRQNSIFGKLAMVIVTAVGGPVMGAAVGFAKAKANEKNLARLKALETTPEVTAAIKRSEESLSSGFMKVLETGKNILSKVFDPIKNIIDPIFNQAGKAVDEATAPRRLDYYDSSPAMTNEPATGGTGVGDFREVGGDEGAASIIDKLGKAESGGKDTAVNTLGYEGKLQFGPARLKDFTQATGKSTEGFLNNSALQREVEKWHVNDIENYIVNNKLDRFYGQNIAGVDVNKDAIIGMAHLGGNSGAKQFLETGGEYNPSDAYGTSLSDYGKKFSSAEVELTDIQKQLRSGYDKSKQARERGTLPYGPQVAGLGPVTNEQLRQYNQGYITAGDRYAMTMGGRGLQGTRPEGFGNQNLGFTAQDAPALMTDPRDPNFRGSYQGNIPPSNMQGPNFTPLGTTTPFESNMRDRNMRPPAAGPTPYYDAFGNTTIFQGRENQRVDTGIPLSQDPTTGSLAYGARNVQDQLDAATSEYASNTPRPYNDPGAYTSIPGMNVSPSNMQGPNFTPVRPSSIPAPTGFNFVETERDRVRAGQPIFDQRDTATQEADRLRELGRQEEARRMQSDRGFTPANRLGARPDDAVAFDPILQGNRGYTPTNMVGARPDDATRFETPDPRVPITDATRDRMRNQNALIPPVADQTQKAFGSLFRDQREAQAARDFASGVGSTGAQISETPSFDPIVPYDASFEREPAVPSNINLTSMSQFDLEQSSLDGNEAASNELRNRNELENQATLRESGLDMPSSTLSIPRVPSVGQEEFSELKRSIPDPRGPSQIPDSTRPFVTADPRGRDQIPDSVKPFVTADPRGKSQIPDSTRPFVKTDTSVTDSELQSDADSFEDLETTGEVFTPSKATKLPGYEKGFGTVTPDKFNNLVPGLDLEPEFLRDAEGNPTTTRNPRAGMSFEYDLNDPKSRAEANAKLNFFSKTGKARPEYILAGGRKVPSDSAVAQNDAENTASGYTGTGSGGVAIGKISGENGLSGVVKDPLSKGGKLAARANGKTVYKDSSGKAYTNSTFGSKVEVKQNKDGSWSNKTTAKGETVKYSKEAGVSSGHGTAQEQDNSDNGSDSGKIICTAMNASYGFGSYRQAVWLNYSNKHLTKEHEVGYHTLFLPLVHLAYTKDNKLIRKLLEHGTRRRTADIRAELRGTKRNTLGRIYRAVLEPLCYGVGKIKMTLGE